MGSKKHNKNSPWSWHNTPSRKVCPRTVETSKGEGRVGTKEEAQEEDGHPGGSRQTEAREATKEGGARGETGGTRSRRSLAGSRPQAEEQGRRGGSGGPRRSRWCRRPTRRRGSGRGHWRAFWRRGLWRTLTGSRHRNPPTLVVAQSTRHTQLTLSRTHTDRGVLPPGGRCCPIRFSPESIPRRRQNPLEDHFWTTALCLRCSDLHHRMSRVRIPGSWWR